MTDDTCFPYFLIFRAYMNFNDIKFSTLIYSNIKTSVIGVICHFRQKEKPPGVAAPSGSG